MDTCAKDELAERIDVWSAEIAQLDAVRMRSWCNDHLPTSELERLSRIIDDAQVREYLATRILRRWALSQYAGCSLEKIHFRQNEFGKPFVDSPAEATTIAFSTTHVPDLVACAFTQRGSVGIDVVRADTTVDIDALTNHFLSKTEAALIQRRPEDALKIWTAKEALLKAIGTGFSTPPESITIDLRDDRAVSDRWTVQFHEPTDRHLAAIACEKLLPVVWRDATPVLQTCIAVKG